MHLRDRLILAPINNLNPKDFRENFQDLTIIDRDFFIQKILHDKYSPIFLNYINNHQLQDLFNKKEISHLKNQTKRFQIQSLEIVKELIYIDRLFKEKKINPIYLKGASVMNEYSDISLRPAVDIDILFKGEEVFDAYEILHKYNYKEPTLLCRSRDELIEYVKTRHHLPGVCRDTNIMIELHHRVTNHNDFNSCPLSDKIINHKRSFNFYGSNIYVPSIEDLIVHQLVHFSVNTKFNNLLRTFSDISQIEKNYKIDWIKIYSNNQGKKLRRALSLSLEVLNYNFSLTNRFSNLKNEYKEYFPKKEIVREAYKKTFRLEKTKIHEKSLYALGKSTSFSDFLKIIFSKIFLNRDQIMQNYSISKLNYFSFFYFQCLSILSRLINYIPLILSLLLRNGSIFEDFKGVKKIEEWLN